MVTEKQEQYALLKTQLGFQFYIEDLKDDFDKKYGKLRKSAKNSTYYRLQGYLDGLEYAMTLVDTELE